MSDNFFSLVLGLIFLCDSSLWAADSVLVQAGQTFLPADAEVKIDKLKANAVALKEAAVKEIEMNVGETLTFKNLDKVTHNVYTEVFDLKAQPPGETRAVKLEQAGTFDVQCAIHPKMKFKLKVK